MISSSCAAIELFIISITMNELITKIAWGFKDMCVYL